MKLAISECCKQEPLYIYTNKDQLEGTVKVLESMVTKCKMADDNSDNV